MKQLWHGWWVALLALALIGLGGCTGSLVTSDDDDAGDDDGGDDDAGDDDAGDDDAGDDDAGDDDAGDDDAGDDDAGDDDAGDDDAEIPPQPGFTWEVLSGPHAGSYHYDTEVFCDYYKGFPGIWAADDWQWHDQIGFTLYAEPGPNEQVTDCYFGWGLGPLWFDADCGPNCWVKTVQGWQEVTGYFECEAELWDKTGPPQTVEVVNGAFRCP